MSDQLLEELRSRATREQFSRPEIAELLFRAYRRIDEYRKALEKHHRLRYPHDNCRLCGLPIALSWRKK